jgi:hypothetical protein
MIHRLFGWLGNLPVRVLSGRNLKWFLIGAWLLVVPVQASQAQGWQPSYQPNNAPINAVPGMVDPVQPSVQQQPPSNPFVNAWSQAGAGQSANFWQNFMTSRVNAGTVLTGTMQDDLSSNKSKVGDVFAVTIDQGYFFQDKPLVPPGSKVLGAVTGVTPAKAMRNGAPGNVSIALQTIVFPDGRSAPFSAFVQFNPNQQANRDQVAGKKGQPLNKEVPVGSYLNSLKGMGFAAVSGITRMGGVRYSPRSRFHPGSEFSIEHGQQIALKLNRTLDLTTMSPPTAQPWGSATTNAANPGSNTAPGPFTQDNGPALAPDPRSSASVPGQNEPF